jgi:hypothetical protein
MVGSRMAPGYETEYCCPPEVTVLPPVPFPDVTPIGSRTAPWYLHPAVLVGGGVIGAVVLMKVLKR